MPIDLVKKVLTPFDTRGATLPFLRTQDRVLGGCAPTPQCSPRAHVFHKAFRYTDFAGPQVQVCNKLQSLSLMSGVTYRMTVLGPSCFLTIFQRFMSKSLLY